MAKININQELDVDALIEEIEFAYCIGIPTMNPVKAVPLETLYNILANHFPQIQTYINGTITINNT